MKKLERFWTKDGFTLRPARAEDAEAYYEENFCPLDQETARLTGCKEQFSREEVVSFFLRCLDAEDRYDFLAISPAGNIIGESVLNEIDWEAKSANFRIAIFHPDWRGRGLGTWMVRVTRDFAFRDLGLHRLSLDVYSFNPGAERVYRSAGFVREGVLRDAVRDGDAYADDILMALLEEDWRALVMAEKGRTILETRRLTLREMTQADLPALCRILQDKDVMYAYAHAFSDEEAQAWLDNQLRRYRDDGFGLWAVILKETGKLIGQCGLTWQDWSGTRVLEVGYLFQKAFWHQGYATEAAVACKEYAFETLNAREVFSIIRDTNLPSQRVAMRNGMTLRGSFVKHYYGLEMPHLVFSARRPDRTERQQMTE